MATNVPPWPGDFESVAQQYWSLWGDALRQVGAAPAMPMPGAAPGWQQTVDWWAQLVPGGQAQVDEAVGRFQRQASQWFGQMQQVAAQFTGRDHDATDIGRAWRSALGMADPTPAHNPFADIFRSMQGGAHGLDGWIQQLRPWLENLQRDGDRWLHVPTFGLTREHQERWQHLAQAFQDYQQRVAEYDQLMLQVAQDAFVRFERKLEAHAEPGRQLQNARALFDLWIDAAEEAYAQVALSEDFRHAFGGLANAQARLRLGVQREVEQVCTLFGMPTRTEVDSAHRKIVELERALRRATRAQAAPVRRAPVQRAAAAPAEAPVPAEAPPSPPPAPRPAEPKVVKKAAKKRPPSRKPASAAKAAPKQRAAAKKKTAKKPARRAVAAAAPLATRQERAPAEAPTVARKPARARTTPQTVPKARVAKAPKKTAAPAGKPAAVVSMKDWVARNAARAATAQAPKAAGKTKRGKGK